MTKRVELVSLDLMELDGWSPVEIFPLVPILENFEDDAFHSILTHLI